MDDLPIDANLYGATYGDATLPTSVYQVVTSVAAPGSQSDFNTAGSGDPTAVLGNIAAAVSGVANAAVQIQDIPLQYKFNMAAAQQANQLGLQTLKTQAGVAQLQNATLLAQAQAAYNRAAGVVTPESLVIVLTVAGLVLAALALKKK